MPNDRRLPAKKPGGWESDLQYIQDVLIPRWVMYFSNKNKGYGDDSGKLGVAGGFVDMWRKVLKLKRSIWLDEPIGEDEIEIVCDMIGHAFLLWVDLQGEAENKESLSDWDHS